MNQRVQCGLTAGLAIVGASVIAISPIAPSTTASPRIVEASAALMANFAGLDQAELVVLSAQRLAEQFQQLPFAPLVAALDIAGGDNARLYTVVRNIIDAPVYVADPIIEALADTLPLSLGGGSDNVTSTTAGDGALMQFRNNELLGLRDAAHQPFADALGVPASTDANYAWSLSNGVAESAVRTVSGLASGALGVIPVAEAIASGNNADLYVALRAYNDAPLWAADPAIEGLAEALPKSLGGDDDNNAQTPNNGALMKFRHEQLWGATHNSRVAIAGLLKVELDAQDNPVTNSSLQRGLTTNDSSNKLQSRVKDATAKAQTNASNVAKKVKAAVKKLTKPADAD